MKSTIKLDEVVCIGNLFYDITNSFFLKIGNHYTYDRKKDIHESLEKDYDELVEEAHRLEGGLSRIRCFKDLSLKYKFNLDDMIEKYVESEDEEYLCKYGSFPNNINELFGKY
jgi:hypothetical protein